MCSQKMVGRKMSAKQVGMLKLKEIVDGLVTVNGVGWCRHVPRRDNDSVLRVALDVEVSGKRK